MEQVDVVVVGAGVIGLAIAAKLSQCYPNLLVVDRHTNIGGEISSRNSEVIHAGLYYPSDSLKAKLCVQGQHLLYQHCREWQVPCRRAGKLIIANGAAQTLALHKLARQAKDNGATNLALLTKVQAAALAPHIRASEALYSASTGIIDSHNYMLSLMAKTERQGGNFVGLTEFVGAERVHDGFILRLENSGETMRLKTRYLINSAGLHCVDIAQRIEGLNRKDIPQLHWCKGHYFSYRGRHPFSHLVYPMPELNTTGLGVHATLDMAGQLKFGPDTLYISQHHSADYTVPEALRETFYQAIINYFPKVELERLQPAYAGIRPKLQGPSSGFADFNIQLPGTHHIPGLVNLFGIESPGLTASLAIAEYVANELLE
ncbi:NAD(P)/FAD-dependent oxidoreductase [Shewanella colwelliana]|uniref:NAD(P)/FAD-dependent oxidoreductase n=1 Tax=Shewanella colwelliana TaxID=23 RepID=UPI0037355699